MTQPFFQCTMSAKSRSNEFLNIKTLVRKTHHNNGHTGSSCLDKAVPPQGGGGGDTSGHSVELEGRPAHAQWGPMVGPPGSPGRNRKFLLLDHLGC